MKRFILTPDSFKGTMSSIRICDIMEEAVKSHFLDAVVQKVPIADGGEGTVDCFMHAVGGERITVSVSGPFLDPVEASYLRLADKTTAVIEMASAAGLPLAEGRLDPSSASTFGVGQLIRDAVKNGCSKVILGLGGSATNDGGAGMAAALGVNFYDAEGQKFLPVGGSLDKIAKIDFSACRTLLESCHIIAMCDVTNPLCGPEGASAVFGPQKGADSEMVRLLDKNLGTLATKIAESGGSEVLKINGGGAAGGMGAGAVAFLGAELKSGIETMLDTVNFDGMLRDADYVLTGEGRLDGQSLRGKVVDGVARRAKAMRVPVIAIVGDIGDDIDGIYQSGVTAVLSINRVAVLFAQARKRCESDLRLTTDTLMTLLAL